VRESGVGRAEVGDLVSLLPVVEQVQLDAERSGQQYEPSPQVRRQLRERLHIGGHRDEQGRGTGRQGEFDQDAGIQRLAGSGLDECGDVEECPRGRSAGEVTGRWCHDAAR
jgi:hypothetical protein